jgi:hypothetical protein
MHKSTLLDIIRTFSSDELVKFEDFLRSPYFNKKENILSLFLEIKKYSPEFTDEKLNRVAVWQNIIPEKLYNYGTMKNMIYELVKLAERFITLEFINSNDLRMFHDLTQALDSRNLEKILSTKLLSFEKNYNLSGIKDSNISVQDYYFFLSKIYWQKIYTYNTSSLNSGLEKETNTASEYLIISFLIYIFKVYDNLRVMKVQENSRGDTDIIDLIMKIIGNEGWNKILDFVKSGSEIDFRHLNCYYSMYKSVSSMNNPENYYNFKTSLFEMNKLINKNDLRDLYINLTNSLMNLMLPEIYIEKESNDIYSMMISNKIFAESNGSLSDNIFNNYIISQSSLLTHQEIEKFITEFLEKIPSDKRENCYNFGMAHVCFIKGEYILSINFQYFDMKYYVKNLQMMNYYELDNYEAFILAFDSYKHFTGKNKNVPKIWKVKTSAFYNTVKSLFHLRDKYEEYKFINLKKEITESLASRKTWLLKKLDELEARNNEQ